MKCRYDPKYALQYKSKHTKHVKLSKKVRFPLDTKKWYPNRECPHLPHAILSWFDSVQGSSDKNIGVLQLNCVQQDQQPKLHIFKKKSNVQGLA
jgi:hypothetical protein